MTFDNSISLSRMADDARRQFSANQTRAEKIDGLLDQQMNGKSMGQLTAGTVVSFFWLAAYLLLFFLAYTMQETPLPYIALGISLLLMLLLLMGQFSRLKYYGSISRTRSHLSQIRSRMESCERALPADSRSFAALRASGWQEALQSAPSIPEELDNIERSVAAMTALQTGTVSRLTTLCYYATGLIWTAAGSYALEELLYSAFSELSGDWVQIILIVGMLISMAVQYFLAKLLWSRTNCTVGNVTLLATVAGPVIFVLLIAAVCLVIGLVYLVFQLMVYALALLIGGSILAGLCSGG